MYGIKKIIWNFAIKKNKKDGIKFFKKYINNTYMEVDLVIWGF